MDRIKQLDDITVNRIAAGEVVTRPASVVKELIENAIDAQSSYITIEIEKGGVDLIRVSDNGTGIDAHDVSTAFLKHATSKISSADDLDNISSLGFRGEALPSIASVADVELTTRTENVTSGSFFHVRAGKVLEEKPIGCPEGTSMSVKNLFFNTPARLKFLKASGVEASYVSDVVSRYIMAHPEISFKYINNGKTIYHSTGNGDLRTSMYSIYGKEVNTDALELNYSEENFEVHGIIGKPSISKQNRRYESVFINGRYVQNNTISLAVKDAMETLLMTKRFPLFAIAITMPFDDVDVNVHPAKLMVKFKEEKRVYDIIFGAVKRLFTPNAEAIAENPIDRSIIEIEDYVKPEPSMIIPAQTHDLENVDSKEDHFLQKKDYTDEVLYKKSNFKPEVLTKLREVSIESNITGQMKVEEAYEFSAFESGALQEKLEFSIIGQVFNTYIIVQIDDNMLIIDQHAAHERINYDMLKKSINERETISQQLLVPFVLEVSPLEKELIDENMEIFNDIGFEIDSMGDRSIKIGSVPYILGGPQLKDCFNDMLESLFGFKKMTNYDLKKEKLIQTACKSSIKGGDKLEHREIEALIRHFKENNVTLTCPHGRPIVYPMTKHDLEKIFKRTV